MTDGVVAVRGRGADVDTCLCEMRERVVYCRVTVSILSGRGHRTAQEEEASRKQYTYGTHTQHTKGRTQAPPWIVFFFVARHFHLSIKIPKTKFSQLVHHHAQLGNVLKKIKK